MKLFKLTTLATALSLFVSCIQTEITMEVKPDGSGTMTEKIIVTPYLEEAMGQMMSSMMGGNGKATKSKGKKTQIVKIDKESGIKAAEGMGEGVTWVSSKPIKSKEGEGAILTFKFTDVNKLNGVDMNPMAAAGLKPSSTDKAHVQFSQDNGISRLTFIQTKEEAAPPEAAPMPNAENPAVAPEATEAPQINPLPTEEQLNPFRGLKAKVSIKIAGNIKQTNATLRKGNEITLLDMDMDKLLAAAKDTTILRKLADMPQDVKTARKSLSLIPGMSGDTNDTLWIEYSK